MPKLSTPAFLTRHPAANCGTSKLLAQEEGNRNVAIWPQVTSNSVLPVERKIVQFSEGPLDPSLFVVPHGFKKLGVRDFYWRNKNR